MISEMTNINQQVLDSEKSLRSVDTATKMRWIAGRSTAKVEDKAYCMLGLFDVHMPILYGEGDKAFLRLQEEIMKSSDDISLLS